MKREILFRGLTRTGNKMIYGDVRQYEDCPVIMKSFVYMGVLPETLSQYTGKKDKNGTRIFEGDVVRYSFIDEESGIEVSEDFLVQWNGKSAGFTISSDKWQDEDNLDGVEIFEVVGNVFENPKFAEYFKKTIKAK